MLIFIGTGLSIKHLTIEAISYIIRADKIYIDTYTNLVPDFSYKILSSILRDKEIVYAKRRDLEGENIRRIIEEARHRDIAIIVPGDPFIATTHDAIRVEALKNNVEVVVVNGLSIYSLAASRTGLQAYRFGKTVTLVYPRLSKPYSVIEAIYDNLSRDLHTLVLLEISVEENKYMTIDEAVNILLEIDDKNMIGDTLGVGLARIGLDDEYIVADKISKLPDYTYPPPPHSLIVIAKPHPVELENLKYTCGLPYDLYVKYSRSKSYP
ncbi:MAG: diphthine synthase [Desulfurococcales archaeon ex4484_58]|nr:MAG: diphthine synthase [Desulfurococcales archaeon ex4484_58]